MTTYSYNLANWVTNLSNKNSSGATLSSYAYTYYASGNQKSKTDNSGKVTSYVYDGLGRLTSESESGGVTLSYTYDEAGNRTKLTATGTESYVIDYSYNNVNQLTSETKTEGGATETTGYTYDANGNMVSKALWKGTDTNTSPEESQANTYNNLNQLVSSITAGVTSSYTYNVDGIRTTKTVGSTTTYYLLDGGNVVDEVENGTVTATYLRGANLLSTSTDDETSYYLFNAHGDVTGLTNENETVTKSYDYDAFGNEKNPSATDTNPFRYCGEYYDTETGTYYLRARYYDPSIGRFTQQDTHWNVANMIYGDNPNKINEREDALGLKAYTYTPSISSIMQSGNLYVYCMNIPTNMLDSSGHLAQWLSNSIDFVKNEIINPILNYYNPNTFTLGGQFQDEIFYGIGTLTGGYSEYNCRLQINAKNNQANGMVGIFAKISTGNATGKIGIKTNNTTISLKGVGDGLTGTAQAGIQYKDGFGLIGKAKASVLTGRSSIELEIFGWQFEIGVSGDILSIGAEAVVGYFPEDGFAVKSSVGAGWFGWGFLFRAKPTMMLEM